MKTYTLPTITKSIFILILAAVFLGGCKQEDNVEPAVKTSSNNSTSAAEKFNNNIFQKGSNFSSATGEFNGTYNKETKVLTYSITYANITPTAINFHRGKLGVNGDIEIAVGGPFSSPITKSTSALTASQEAALLAGEMYVSIQTVAFPEGEIRAQVFPNQVQFNNIPFTGDSVGTGTFNGTYDKSTKVMTYSVVYSGYNPNEMFFSKGIAGQVGEFQTSVSAPFISPINKATAPLTAAQEADLLYGQWFISMKSDDQQSAEMRAQLVP